MHIRTFRPDDLARLIDLTIDTFGPFYEDHFRPLVGEVVHAHQHGRWADDYRAQVPTLHDPDHDSWVAVAEEADVILGYVAWSVDPVRRHGDIELLAVDSTHRRSGTGLALCRHVLADMRARDVEVVGVGTGGDDFHAPARRLYERLGLTGIAIQGYLGRP